MQVQSHLLDPLIQTALQAQAGAVRLIMKLNVMRGQVKQILSGTPTHRGHPDDLQYMETLKKVSTKHLFEELKKILHELVERNNKEVDGYQNNPYDWDSFNTMSNEEQVKEMENMIRVLQANRMKELRGLQREMSWVQEGDEEDPVRRRRKKR